MTQTKELTRQHPVHGTDFFKDDDSFRSLLKNLVPAGSYDLLEERLKPFSQKASGPWDGLAEEAALKYPFPQGVRIEHYDRVGNIIDQMWFPPPVRELRRDVVASGIFDNRSQIEQFTKVYLLSHLGEVSLTCPLACTEGLIRSVSAVGSDFLKNTYLPKLRSVETPLAGAQFVTEQDMGSDIGALTTRAVPAGEGQWRLYGEKWFCSALDEYFLIAARPEGAPAGTAGVAVFLVPRTYEGKLNNLRIKRLKEKIGTRELPTAEIDLNGAMAYNIGPVEAGFKTLMNYVLNTSRVMNAASGCGMMARSYLEAKNYAEQRSAFGRKIIEYPMVNESLLKIQSILAARRALFFYLVSTLDQHPQTDLGSDEAFWQRFLINLCKYRTAIGATECSHEAILLLGGNGTIETFSILPRLYRDSIVIETWEGTHNTLALQIARDGTRFPFKEYLSKHILEKIEFLQKKGSKDTAAWLQSEWKNTEPGLSHLTDPAWVASKARTLTDRLGALLEVAIYGSLASPAEGPLLEKYRNEIGYLLRPL